MKAHQPYNLSRKQQAELERILAGWREKLAGEAAKQINAEKDAIAWRAQALWMVGMLNAGLKPSTVGRVLKEVEKVLPQYNANIDEGVADWAIYRDLKSAGVTITAPAWEDNR